LFVSVTKDTVVDISHESLIWKWKRLGEWVAEEAVTAELYRYLVKDCHGKATWGEPKLASTLAVRHKDAWNEDWALQYSDASFADVESFLERSRRAVRNQRLLRWFGLAAAVAIAILAVIAYYAQRQAAQNARALAGAIVARDSLVNDESALTARIASLNASQGATQEERDRIATEKSDLEAQLKKAQDKEQALNSQIQSQSTDALSTTKSLQSQLAAAQQERDQAVQARNDEAKRRQEAESKSTQIEAKVNTLTKDLESARVAPGSKSNPKDGLVYVWIPPGKFRMGCSPGDTECDAFEAPAHDVTITKGFWIGQTEVTQEAYQRVTGKTSSYFKGARLPADYINWDGANNYCRAISGRLPTEAEWEYAARAGDPRSRYGDIDNIAWYGKNSSGKAHEVAQKAPNAWGVYDMLGNISEWTADWYAGLYPQSLAIDPAGPASGYYRALRGGSWTDYSTHARASYRDGTPPDGFGPVVGFRCAGE
jgi:formylglycine-generating enzyme required for sulfatase activity